MQRLPVKNTKVKERNRDLKFLSIRKNQDKHCESTIFFGQMLNPDIKLLKGADGSLSSLWRFMTVYNFMCKPCLLKS